MYLITAIRSYVFLSAVDISDFISFGALFVSFITVAVAIISNNNANRSATAAENSAKSGDVAAQAAENAAQASKEANIYAKKQTELLEKDLLNTHSPKLIPIASQHEFNLVTMDQDLDLMSIYSHDEKSAEGLFIEITNVSKGNAYMVSSRLEIDASELFNVYDFKCSPKSYNEKHSHLYQFRVSIPNQTTDSKLTAQIIEGDEVTREKTTIDLKTYKRTPIVRENDSINVSVPKYILQILIDTLYRGISDKNYLNGIESKLIHLIIEYKTGSQLETNDFTTKKYALSITDLDFVEPIPDGYGNFSGNCFVFSLDFDFIE